MTSFISYEDIYASVKYPTSDEDGEEVSVRTLKVKLIKFSLIPANISRLVRMYSI